MSIIGNPWAQDVASFGQQTGNSLAQALIGLPQQRYEMALRQQQLQRGMQQMQMQNQYRNGLLGLRQQGLEQRGASSDMANQLRMLQLQLQGQHYGNMENRPISLGGGNVLVPQGGGSGQGEATQQGMMGNPPNPQQLPQSGQEYGGFKLMQAPKASTQMTDNQRMGNFLNAGVKLAQFNSSTNPTIREQIPAFSNAFYHAQLPGAWQGQQQQQTQPQQMPQQVQQGMGMNTNSLTQPQQQPQQSPQGFDTNAIMQQAMQAIQAGANPQAVHQRLQQQYGLSLQ